VQLQFGTDERTAQQLNANEYEHAPITTVTCTTDFLGGAKVSQSGSITCATLATSGANKYAFSIHCAKTEWVF